MSTSVVTGGAGFLGSHLCERLLAAGQRVVCIDNLDTGTLENIEHLRDGDFEFVQHDITEFVEVPEDVDFIYHLASPASPIDYLRLPLHTLKVGSYGTHHMLGVAKLKRARFLLASTSEVYGDPKVHPQSETYWGNVNPIGPRGVYDEAKRYAEALTMAYHRQQGVDTCISRTFNSYGARMRAHDGRAIPTFLRQALQDKPITVFGDGSQTRSFCYVDDQVSGIVALAESDVHQPVNIGNPDEFTLLQLAETVKEITESDSEIVFAALPVDDPQVRQPDISRAKELLGWEPRVGLAEGLRMTIEQAGRERLIGEPGLSRPAMPGIPASLVPAVGLGLRALGRLPRPVQQRIAGDPVAIDGQRLEPEIQLVLALEERLGEPPYYELPVAEARRSLLEDVAAGRGPPARLGETRRLSVTLGDGPREARLYVPEDAADPGGLLVAFHGGGWALGSLDSHEPAFGVLARDSGVRVLSVDYRLAPEDPFPAAAEDALAAFRWAVEHAAELGADPARIGVGGDSAGGNLCAVVARLAASDPSPPAFQALLYPVTDLAAKTRSYELFREGFYLSESQMDWYIAHYLTDPSQREDPRASPLRDRDLSGLAPAYVAVAGFDPLRDEGIAYARRLLEAGVEVELDIHRGLIHGFINMSAVSRGCDAAVRALCAAVRARLGG